MNADDADNNDPFVRVLADYDEALAAGREPSVQAPPGELERWQKDVAVIALLRRMGNPDSRIPRRDHPEVPPLPARIGRYAVERELGRGGMGIVYAAYDPDLGRRVAVKVLHDPDDERAARLRNEAGALARLQHANIVQVFEVGVHDGQPYLVMELVGGAALKASRDELLPPVRAADLLARVAHAIQHAHDQGILHRDLKPANILLGLDGSPKVTDFGLAKQIEISLDLTRTGAALGTPNYMSPEQASGQPPSVALDVYGLGATLYALLTGRPPFVGPAAFDVMQQVVKDEPVSVRLLSPTVPPDLETICHKCLEKEPARRYQSARELAEDLERFLGGRPVLARPVSGFEKLRRWCGRNRALTGLAAGLLLVLIAGVVATGLFAAWALQERDRVLAAREEAAEQAEMARTVRDFLQHDIIGQINPNTQTKGGFKAEQHLTLRDALDRAAPLITRRFAGRPRLEAAIRGSIGQGYLGLGLQDKAIPYLEAAVRLVREARGPDHVELIEPLTALATAQQMAAIPDRRLLTQRELYRLRRFHLGDEAAATLEAGHQLGSLELSVGRQDYGRALLDELLTRARNQHGKRSLQVLEIQVSLVVAGTQDNRTPNPARYLEDLLETPVDELTELFHPDHNYLPGMLGCVFVEANRADRACQLLLRALAEYRKRDPGSFNTLQEILTTGDQFRLWGCFNEAVPLYREVREQVRAKFPDSSLRLECDTGLAECLLFTGGAAEAEPILNDLSRSAGMVRLPAGPGKLAMLRGWCYLQRQQYAEAEAVLELACLQLTQPGSSPGASTPARCLLGQTLLAMKRYDLAEAKLLEAHELLCRETNILHRNYYLGSVQESLVTLYEAMKLPDKATLWRARKVGVEKGG